LATLQKNDQKLSLNPAQEKAVTHSGSPLLVVAGPGSGKTKVIIERVLHLVKNDVKPSQILCLTFSEKATEEMQQRLEKSIDISDMDICTFHAFSKDVLDDHILESGISMSSGVISKAAQLVWGINHIDNFKFENIEIGNNAYQVITSIIEGISTFKKELVPPQQLEKYLKLKLKKDLSDEEQDFLLKLSDLCKVYYHYQNYQRDKSLIDFDDMIVETINLLRSKPTVLSKYQNKYTHILVDEFQDNNYAQLELVKLLAKNGNVTVVGDDDQCIYRFQGAYLTNFKDFLKHFPKTTTVNLDQNYRSTQNIVNIANQCLKIVPKNHRQEKHLFSKNEKGEKTTIVECNNESAEVEFVVKKIKELVGKPIKRRDGSNNPLEYRDITILSRRRMDGKKFSNALKALGMPAKYLGESDTFSAPVVRDLMANLKIARAPTTSGVEMTRLMKNHGISEQNIAKINHAAKKKAYDDPSDVDYVLETMQSCDRLDITQKDEVKELVQQIDTVIKLANSSSISNLVYKIMMSVSDLYKRSIQYDTPQHRRYQALLKEIYKIALDYENLNPEGNLDEFIKYLYQIGNFEIQLEEGNELENAIQITTIHQSKGKEFSLVFIVDAATNKLPLKHRVKKFYVPNEISQGVQIQEDEKELHLQEERRLLYVAMTRAQNLLYITFAKKYGQNIRESKPSIFLEEINFETNPLVNFVQFEGTEGDYLIEELDRTEKIKQDIQFKAVRSVNKMHLKTAIQRIIELAKIKYFEENGNLKGFDPQSVLNVNNTDTNLEKELKGTKIPLVDKESLSLSKGKIDTYNKCPLQFKFRHILRVPTPSRASADIGNAVHAVLEKMTKYEIDGQKLTQKQAFDLLEKMWDSRAFESETAANQAKAQAKELILTYLKWNKENPNEPIAVEKAFKLILGEVKFNGYIDRIDKTPDGEYEVIDYKTGSDKITRVTIKDDIQMNLYALGTEKLYGKLPKTTSLFYLKKDKMVVNDIDSEKVNEVKNSIEDAVKSILDEKFPANPSYSNCKFCDFWDICDEKETQEN